MSAPNSEAPAGTSGTGLRGQLRFVSAANLNAGPENRAKALAARRARIALGRAKYPARLADSHWAQLAARRDLRLPEAWVPPTPHKLRQWAKRVLPPDGALTPADLPPRLWGFSTWAKAIEANPAWSLRSFVGLMLEGDASVAP